LATIAAASSPFVRSASPQAASQPTVSLGLVADAQYAEAEPLGTRFYRQSVAKLTETVKHFNRLELAFCVGLGDLIDRDWQSYDAILAALAASRHPFHHVLGNHDFEVGGNRKADVPRRLGLTQRYYALERGPWCFVMLDTNDISLYAHPESTPAHAEALVALKRLAATGALNAQTWNGAVSDRQLQWFETTCQSAAKARRRVVVLAHHPVHPEGSTTCGTADASSKRWIGTGTSSRG
jgi:3',5'-cyclic AMP phosphodiesterase CpdA